MATTYEAIATVTVGSGGAASIDFSSIPNTYTDLVLYYNFRPSTADSFLIAFNGSSANFTQRLLEGNGSSASSGSNALSGRYIGYQTTTTASTFGSGSLYIPNYAGSTNKSFSVDWVGEANATSAYSNLIAGLWSNTSAINQITISLLTGGYTLVQHSSATLYGIKNS